MMHTQHHTAKKWPRLLRRSLRVLLGIYLFLVIGMLIADQFIQFRDSDASVAKYFEKRQQFIGIGYYPSADRQIRYLYTGKDATKPIILFIHGAPSSSTYYEHFLDDPGLRQMANLVAVDRPGYGYSGFGKPVPDLERQAAMIRPLLDSLNRQPRPVLVVAASYGTSIACRLAMDYPDLVDGLLLLAPSLAPGEEKTYTVSYVLESPFFSWAQPRTIHSANVEKLAHKAELNRMLPNWHKITQPVQYFQGAEDELIYTSNADFAKARLTKASFLNIRMLPKRGHLIVYDERVLIRKSIVDMLSKADAYYAARADQWPPSSWQASK